MADQKSTNSDSSWVNLSYPFDFQYTSPTRINEHEFIVIASTLNNHGVFSFSTKSNQWTKMFDYNTDPAWGVATSSAFNKNKNMVYICARYCVEFRLYVLDLKKKTITKIDDISTLTKASSMICINNKTHAIVNGTHQIYDEQNKHCQVVHEFDAAAGISGHGFCYLQRRKSIIFFGGYRSFQAFDSIYEYSLSSKAWNKLNVTLPLRLSHFLAVSTRFDQYVIILGGWIDGSKGCDDIYVFDIKHLKVMKSQIKCPGYGYTRGIITDNLHSDELLTFGFVNECFKSKVFHNVQMLPHYLIQLISKWVCHQNIHVITCVQYGCKINKLKHWRINVDDIVNGCFNSQTN